MCKPSLHAEADLPFGITRKANVLPLFCHANDLKKRENQAKLMVLIISCHHELVRLRLLVWANFEKPVSKKH